MSTADNLLKSISNVFTPNNNLSMMPLDNLPDRLLGSNNNSIHQNQKSSDNFFHNNLFDVDDSCICSTCGKIDPKLVILKPKMHSK